MSKDEEKRVNESRQLSLPLTGDRLPPRAAERRHEQNDIRNVMRARAALRAAEVRKSQQIDETRNAIRAVKRRAAATRDGAVE